MVRGAFPQRHLVASAIPPFEFLVEAVFLPPLPLQRKFLGRSQMLLHIQSHGEGKKLVQIAEGGPREAVWGTGMARTALGAQRMCLLLFTGLALGAQLRDGHQLLPPSEESGQGDLGCTFS